MVTNVIFPSKTRARLMQIFFENPDSSYYLRELARKTGMSSGTIHRELSLFLKEKLLQGNSKFFHINKEYPLFPEHKSIIAKTVGIEHELTKFVQTVKGIQCAFIFGSYAKGTFTGDSDIDLFLIGSINEEQLYEGLHEVEKTIARDINYHIATPADFSQKVKKDFFYNDIMKDIIILTSNAEELQKLISRT